ncbi:Protein of unknown function [Thiohalomonas denitrificans]|uniref:DUF3501 domain-containing protein n=2 Tax=Thiohalomonas denitrificans TaxID=415747 RepID=A0A1G5Q3P8_9GAMM|nr:DUF3501 family protein [Thiohalomonas denitrificans]SCZ56307.1 Protein of unknown function [Thiohalomonas denitrificans]
MEKLTREDLYSLERYAEMRPEFRSRVLEHKKHRQVAIGPNATLYFEDRLTMQYQIQEMLRVERIFEPEAIEEELATYNPLIPDGSNWKATFMLEYPNEEERRQSLAALRGIEKQTYVQVDGFEPVYPIANEDLERTNEEKTSSVHFMRFELTPEMVAAVKEGSAIAMGIEHPDYRYHIDSVAVPVQDALAADLG